MRHQGQTALVRHSAALPSGYLANSIIFADSSGNLANTDNIKFFVANNTLLVAHETINGNLIVAGANFTDVNNTQNTNISIVQGGLNTANANIALTIGVDSSQNTRIDAAFSKANAAALPSGYLSNSIIFADSSGNLANTNNIKFFTANNTLLVAHETITGNLVVAGANFTDVNNTQNTNIAIVQGGLDTANANIALTIAVDASQNTRIDAAFSKANTASANMVREKTFIPSKYTNKAAKIEAAPTPFIVIRLSSIMFI